MAENSGAGAGAGSGEELEVYGDLKTRESSVNSIICSVPAADAYLASWESGCCSTLTLPTRSFKLSDSPAQTLSLRSERACGLWTI